MPEGANMPFVVSSSQHRMLGKLLRLRLADDYVLQLTPAEASSLSFALIAVRDGISPEREIYMSPIASDVDFVGKVHTNGISIALSKGAQELDWDEVGMLVSALARHID